MITIMLKITTRPIKLYIVRRYKDDMMILHYIGSFASLV